VSRRRRRRRLLGWSTIVVLGVTLGVAAGQARAAEPVGASVQPSRAAPAFSIGR
jgi:hypothetical protein